MAAGLTPRTTIPPKEKLRIAESNRKLRTLIDFMKALPDNPKLEEINNVAVVATALNQSKSTQNPE